MTPTAQLIWDTLELRKPTFLRVLEPLTEPQMRWVPPNDSNSIAWQVWHITEVEDNFALDRIYGRSRRYPFGRSVRDATPDQFPRKLQLMDYFREVREITRGRLNETSEDGFTRLVKDETFSEVTVGAVWGLIATSFAWHAGQIALTSRLVNALDILTQANEMR